MKLSLSLLMLMISFTMILLNHPLSIGLMILIQTLLMCLLSGMMIKTYWFSYILFLTFLGGLLVMFIYVSSVASNELFNLSLKMKLFLMISFLFICSNQIMIYLFNYNNINMNWMNFSNNMSEIDKFYLINFFNDENNISLNKLYNNHNFMLMMMLVIYLFISLIAIIKITNINYGPLRSM